MILEKNRKKEEKLENMGKNRSPTSQRSEPTLRQRPTPRRGMPSRQRLLGPVLRQNFGFATGFEAETG